MLFIYICVGLFGFCLLITGVHDVNWKISGGAVDPEELAYSLRRVNVDNGLKPTGPPYGSMTNISTSNHRVMALCVCVCVQVCASVCVCVCMCVCVHFFMYLCFTCMFQPHTHPPAGSGHWEPLAGHNDHDMLDCRGRKVMSLETFHI